jgi:hypothetical protein
MPCHVTTPGPHASYARTPSPHTPVKPQGLVLIPFVTPRSLPDRWYLLLARLSSRIIYHPSQTNTGLLCTLCPHSCAPEKTSRPVTHPMITLGQACLTSRFFRDRLPKNKMHLVGMSTLLILLSLGPGYHRHYRKTLNSRRPRTDGNKP